MPSKNKIVETARYLTKSIEGDNFVNRCYLFRKRKCERKQSVLTKEHKNL